ncbi:hypothetical protein [Parahaliea mediterranea]|uniref:Tryptophan synthase subunit beta like protein n=1 Tax=Parahaliea mediterranea TaxID=651086 RepID=A0A939DDR1_9GAMM|nr:hypothetical protein [Parahaliea mediterranea]MBN7795682.1 hypothetical protein [Parahaliea mediterranea]
MPYVIRNESGHILSVSHTPLEGYHTIAANDPELLEYVSGFGDSVGQHLSASDLDFVRVLEDLVELLVSKGVILFTELPESAREKMLARQRLRSEISGRLDLIGDD